MIKAFECKSSDTVLSIFDSSLTICMYSYILFKFSLTVKISNFSCFHHKTSCIHFWLIYPLHCWIYQFFWVYINKYRVKVASSSLKELIISVSLPGSCVFRICYILLRLIIIFEWNFLHIRYHLIFGIFLLFDIIFLNEFSHIL